MAQKNYEKYIVIKSDYIAFLSRKHFDNLNKVLDEINRIRRNFGKVFLNKYIVCNIDEPYAEQVWKVILDGEDKKKARITMGIEKHYGFIYWYDAFYRPYRAIMLGPDDPDPCIETQSIEGDDAGEWFPVLEGSACYHRAFTALIKTVSDAH
jgi:hypothetical protein